MIEKAIHQCIYQMVSKYGSSKYYWTCMMLYNIHYLNRDKFSSLKECSKIMLNNLSYKCSDTQRGHTNTSSSLCIGLFVFSENTKLLILLCSRKGIT